MAPDPFSGNVHALSGTRRHDRTRISSKHQVTIREPAVTAAGFHPGDEVHVRALGPGQIVLTRVDELLERYRGALPAGTYPAGWLAGAAARRVGVVLLDSSAIVGFLQPDDALHEAAASRIGDAARGGGYLAISVVSWTELLIGAERTPNGRPRSTITPPDALILATAEVHPRIGHVMGGDAQWARVCRSLRVSFVRLRG